MIKELVSNEKLNKASWCIVDEVMMMPIWYLFGALRPRVVTHYLARFERKICVCRDCLKANIIGTRWLTEFETIMLEPGDQIAYTMDYRDGQSCCSSLSATEEEARRLDPT